MFNKCINLKNFASCLRQFTYGLFCITSKLDIYFPAGGILCNLFLLPGNWFYMLIKKSHTNIYSVYQYEIPLLYKNKFDNNPFSLFRFLELFIGLKKRNPKDNF